ncbi:hypothetical protein SF06_06620 [Pseudomonas flexibilis]|nr:hypothetical protein SF06_06620 [Pseudomonas flexibilis]
MMNIQLSELGSEEMSRLLPEFTEANAAVDRALDANDREAFASATIHKHRLSVRIANLVLATVSTAQWVEGVTQ